MSNRDVDILRGDFSNVVLEENQTHSDLFSEAFQKAIEALEKQIPKKPVRRTIYTEYWQRYDTIRVCPVCGVDTPVPRELESWEFWCPDCGQAIDWSEEVNKNEDY